MARLITIKELMEHLQVSRKTIYNYIDKGLPKKMIGNSLRFDLEEVLKYFEEGK